MFNVESKLKNIMSTFVKAEVKLTALMKNIDHEVKTLDTNIKGLQTSKEQYETAKEKVSEQHAKIKAVLV